MGQAEPVSVIIVNYNAGSLLARCVRAVLASSVPTKIIVSDNGSSDESLPYLKTLLEPGAPVTILENGANLGFAAGHNRALPHTTGEFLAFLNPDCLVAPDALERLVEAMRAHPEAGMAGGLVRNADGSVEAAGRRATPTPWRSAMRVLRLERLFPRFRRFRGIDLPPEELPDDPEEVEGISGAFMFVRRRALEDVGPLDEGYFLHCEDLDWFYRFRQQGWKILFVPGAEARHHQGASSAGHPYRILWHKHRGMARFYGKFFRRRYPLFLFWLVLAAIWSRFLLLAAGSAAFRRGKGPAEALLAIPPTDFPRRALVTGAGSAVARELLPRLAEAGLAVVAVSRTPRPAGLDERVCWKRADLFSGRLEIGMDAKPLLLFHLAPLPLLPAIIEPLATCGLERVIAFGTTSRFTKADSANPAERELAAAMERAEEALARTCERLGIGWTLFRPTLIYGGGGEDAVAFLARHIRRFGFFPLVGRGAGLRQPVHAQDLAAACVAALNRPDTVNRAFNLGGGETLRYREMVERIFRSLGRRPRILSIPLPLFRVALAGLKLVPRYRHLTGAMLERMNRDLSFDTSEAAEAFGYAPRGFLVPAAAASADRPVPGSVSEPGHTLSSR